MRMKLNDTGKPIFIDGRLIPADTFYEDPDEVEFVTTDNPAAESNFVIPDAKDITMDQMKEQLTEWGVDYSSHDQNKTTLYAFFVEEATKRVAE